MTRGAKPDLAKPRFSCPPPLPPTLPPRVYVVPADMNGLRERPGYGARICAFGHDDFLYKLKLLEGVSPPTVRERANVERGKAESRSRAGRGRGEKNERPGEIESERVRQIRGG